jgi:hypothetical protein
MSFNDRLKLNKEIQTDECSISKSSDLNLEIENLERQACEIRSSEDWINLQGQQQLQEEISSAKEKTRKAIPILDRISTIERNPAFLHLSDIEQLNEELGKVKIVFQNISLQGPSMELDAILKVKTEARDELECVVCLEVPSLGFQVFSCLEHHLLCSDCAKHILQSCPVCRQNFMQNPPTRNRLAEKMIQRLS